MSARGPGAFYVNVDGQRRRRWGARPTGPAGHRDHPRSSGQDRRCDGSRLAIVLDMAQLTFLDSSAIHCFIKACQVTGHRVVLRNATPAVRRVLELADAKAEPEAWMFDGA